MGRQGAERPQLGAKRTQTFLQLYHECYPQMALRQDRALLTIDCVDTASRLGQDRDAGTGSEPTISTLSIRLRFRPVRIGWCVADNDFDALRKAAQSSFCFWGGRFNPILPVDRPELANALAELFRIDALYKASPGDATERFAEAQTSIRSPLVIRELFSKRWQNVPTANFVDISHPIAQAHDEIYRHNPTAPPSVDLYNWDESDPLRDLFLMTYGQTLDRLEAGLDYHGLMRLQLLAATKIIPLNGELPPLDRTRMTVSQFGQAYLLEHQRRSGWQYPGYYVGSASNFLDLVHFWNLRACGAQVIFFDPEHDDRFSIFLEHWKGALGMLRPGPDRPCAFWHRSDNDIGCSIPIEGRVIDCRIDDGLWNGLNIQPATMSFGQASALGSLSRQHERTTLSFAIPPRPFSDEPRARYQEYVLSVDPGIGLFGNELETLHTPDVPQLNLYYGRECLFGHSSAARAEPDGFGARIPISRDDQSWHALSVQKLLAEIFKLAGILAGPSTAGLVGATLIRQMGGLADCRVFRLPGVRTLIEKHGPEKSFSRSTAKLEIRAHGTEGALDNFQNLYIEHREAHQRLTNDRVLEYLLDRQVFRPGLNFRCGSCQLEFWLSLDDAKTQIACEYCGHVNNAARQLHDKDWAFRRSGLFGRDDHQGGAIPTVLALQALEAVVGSDGGLYTMAMELRPGDADIPPCETDFVFLPQRGDENRQQVAIGECKTRGAIEETDVRNLLAVAKAFPPERFDVFLVFAKLSPFTDEELTLIRSANDEWRQRAIILTQRDLEQFTPYGDDGETPRTVISLREMAAASCELYLDRLG
jgi:hypothetical protein